MFRLYHKVDHWVHIWDIVSHIGEILSFYLAILIVFHVNDVTLPEMLLSIVANNISKSPIRDTIPSGSEISLQVASRAILHHEKRAFWLTSCNTTD